MKITGLIAEYNPFHNGHAYHLQNSRRLTGADYTVVVMSGNFVQRGAPAVTDKYTRTRMALENGADLVLELPVRCALGSAEFFAAGGIALLDALGVIDYVAFGSECGDAAILLAIAKMLGRESREYKDVLRREISRGLSFPAAREQALSSVFPEKAREIQEVFSSPNNILGIEYCRALLRFGSSIRPCTFPRLESDYHQTTLTENFSSASALRRCLKEGDLTKIPSQMPASSWKLLAQAHEIGETADSNDYSLLLKYRLMAETARSLTGYLDVTEDLANRILSQLNRLNSFEEFAALLKTRQMTYTRICRVLFHILLDIPGYSLTDQPQQTAPYARILGFRRKAAPLLHEIKKKSAIPLISKVAAADSLLSSPGRAMLEEDLRCANLYDSVLAIKNRRPFLHEASRPPVII